MSTPIELISRAARTIQSCKTLEQLICAKRYCNLIVRRYGKLVKSDNLVVAFSQACKAEELRKELEQLINSYLDQVK